MLKVQEQTLPNGQVLKTVVLPATIVGIGENIRKLKNAKQTPFRIGTVAIEYPTKDGTPLIKNANASIWDKSYTMHQDLFAKGNKVAVRVQVDGDYKGYGKIELPETVRVDMDLLADFIEQPANDPVVN
jgi:hypothetical protein